MLKKTILGFVMICLLASSSVFAQDDAAPQTGYADVNGLHMYYEIHGTGAPLVVLHGAYMSIQTLGELVPRFAQNRQVIAVELQGHGRTADIEDRPFSYEQMADDIAALMDEIGVEKADIFGYSLGGGVALEIAIRYPEKVDRLVLVSTGYNSEAYHPGFFEMVSMLTPEMFAGTPIVTDYMSLAPNPDGFPRLVEKLIALDSEPVNWSAEEIQSIEAPTLIMLGDSDSVRLEHAVDMFRQRGGGVDGELAGLPNAQLAVLPATTHIGILFRADWVASMVTEFLTAPLS
jgi:pimeloyl-ACP methyl ester carboxylesterase